MNENIPADQPSPGEPPRVATSRRGPQRRLESSTGCSFRCETARGSRSTSFVQRSRGRCPSCWCERPTTRCLSARKEGLLHVACSAGLHRRSPGLPRAVQLGRRVLPLLRRDRRRLRHGGVDRSSGVVRRQHRHDRWLVRWPDAVVRRRPQPSAPQGDRPGGLAARLPLQERAYLERCLSPRLRRVDAGHGPTCVPEE